MRIIDIALKDLRQIARERQSAFFLLIMPVVFTLLFGYAFGGFGSGNAEEDARLPLGVVDEDEGALSAHLLTLLQQSEVVRVVPLAVDRTELERQVTENELAAALIVPPSYSTQTLAAETVPLTLIADPAGTTGFTVQGEVEAAATRLANALASAQLGVDTAVDRGRLDETTARQTFFDDTLTHAVGAWATPPVQVQVTETDVTAVAEGEETGVSSSNAFAQSSPGMMAQFAIAGLITASQVLVLERKQGALRRLLTTNLSRGSILVGHFLAMFVMIVVQLLILIVFGQFALGLPYFRAPGATLLLVGASAVFAASMGLLIGTLAQSEEQAVVFSLVPMFILAALGGAWTPLEFTSEGFQRIAYFTPIAWMVDGFKDIIVRGLGLEAVLLGSGVLLFYALLFWALATWRFRFE